MPWERQLQYELTPGSLLVAGRKPFVEGLGLEDVGVKLNKRGQIEVDDHFKTGVDVSARSMTSHCGDGCLHAYSISF